MSSILHPSVTRRLSRVSLPTTTSTIITTAAVSTTSSSIRPLAYRYYHYHHNPYLSSSRRQSIHTSRATRISPAAAAAAAANPTKTGARLPHQQHQQPTSSSSSPSSSSPFSSTTTTSPTHSPTHSPNSHTAAAAAASRTRDRGPPSSEPTQTDFSALDVLGGAPAPTTGIDATTADGFALDSGVRVSRCGVLLVGGEAFRWRPWVRGEGEGGKEEEEKVRLEKGRLLNARGQFDPDPRVWGVLELVWPKPDLLIIGTGAQIAPLSPATRDRLHALGLRVDVQDSRNAAAQYNLLATERGVQQVAAALVPVGWKEGGSLS